MTINRSHFINILEPGLRDVAMEEFNMNPDMYSGILKVMNSTKQSEKLITTSAFGLFNETPEGQSIDYDNAQEAYSIEVTHLKYALGFRVTEEMYDDDLYGVIQRLARKLGISGKETVEIIAHSLINNGFNASYTYGDGKKLCATDHPLVGAGGGTSSNTLSSATDLSDAALRDAITQFEYGTVNNRGLKLRLRADRLIIPPALEWDAKEITQSDKVHNTANNAINPLKSRQLQIVIDPYLTDADSWFLQDSRQHSLIFFWRKMMKMNSDVDFGTGDGLFKGSMRFSKTVEDWRGFFGVEGA